MNIISSKTDKFIEIEPYWEDCEYLECTYAEWDTGYREYECTLIGDNGCDNCPLKIKYTVTD